MSKIKKIFRLFTDANFRFDYLNYKGLFKNWPDEKVLKQKFKLTFGRELDLNNPSTFNEKLNWLKLYYRKPIFTQMADKYAVKQLVADKIGKEYVVPLYGVWDSPEQIDFNALPNQFVLKCTHNSGGGRCICKDKNKLNLSEVKRGLSKGLGQNYYLSLREWPYKNIKPKIIAEKFLDDHTGRNELTDYKFLCFNGEPKVVYLTNKASLIYENFYDMDFNPLDIDRGFIRLSPEFKKPAKFGLMKELARILASGVPFVRIDFFNIDNHIYFGEFTFYDWGGFKKYKDPKWDKKLGDLLILPKK